MSYKKITAILLLIEYLLMLAKGIRQCLSNDAQNYPFCRSQLVVETFGQLT